MCDEMGNKYQGVYYYNEEKNEIGDCLKNTEINTKIDIVDTYSLIEMEFIYVNEKENQEMM